MCIFFVTVFIYDLDSNTSIINLLSNVDELKKFVEKVMIDLLKKINTMRDVFFYFFLEKVVDIFKVVLVWDINIEMVMNCFFGVNIVFGKEVLLNFLKDLY